MTIYAVLNEVMAGAESHKDIVPWLALLVAISAAGFTFSGYRINRSTWLSRRPYFSKRRYTIGDELKLGGSEADHWQIDSATLIWPFRKTFQRVEVSYNDIGEISSRLVPYGRTLRNGPYSILLSGGCDRAIIRAIATSHAIPKQAIKRWFVVRQPDA